MKNIYNLGTSRRYYEKYLYEKIKNIYNLGTSRTMKNVYMKKWKIFII